MGIGPVHHEIEGFEKNDPRSEQRNVFFQVGWIQGRFAFRTMHVRVFELFFHHLVAFGTPPVVPFALSAMEHVGTRWNVLQAVSNTHTHTHTHTHNTHKHTNIQTYTHTSQGHRGTKNPFRCAMKKNSRDCVLGIVRERMMGDDVDGVDDDDDDDDGRRYTEKRVGTTRTNCHTFWRWDRRQQRPNVPLLPRMVTVRRRQRQTMRRRRRNWTTRSSHPALWNVECTC
jgi:hypothetical protein